MYSSHSIAKVTCLRLSARWIVDLAPIGFEMTAMTLLGADCSTVISAGNGQLSPALASRFNVNRTVECNTDAAGNLVEPDPRRFSTEARHALGASASSLLASAPPCKKPKERTLIGPAEDLPTRARSSRNGGRNHLRTPSDIKSE